MNFDEFQYDENNINVKYYEAELTKSSGILSEEILLFELPLNYGLNLEEVEIPKILPQLLLNISKLDLLKFKQIEKNVEIKNQNFDLD